MLKTNFLQKWTRTSLVLRVLGGVVIVLYLLTTLAAALVAVSASFLFPVTLTLTDATAGESPGSLSGIFAGLLSNMVSNPLSSIASANYVGILFWAVIFGLALRLIGSETTVRVISELADVVSKVVSWVIQFAPFGVPEGERDQRFLYPLLRREGYVP